MRSRQERIPTWSSRNTNRDFAANLFRLRQRLGRQLADMLPIVSRKLAVAGLLFFLSAIVTAQEENASNPLAKVKNTDFRWHYLDLGRSSHLNDFYIDGAFMALDALKLKYELHYWDTNISGSGESGLESVRLKGILFPKEGARGNVKYRIAVGMDWILDLGDVDEGIGTGADQVAPFIGVAMALASGDMLIPLLQHNQSYSGNDVSFTTLRVIWIRTLPPGNWLKADVKYSIDWENDKATPGSIELQYGKNLSRNVALYVDGLAGFGGHRQFDWGIGVGVRFSY